MYIEDNKNFYGTILSECTIFDKKKILQIFSTRDTLDYCPVVKPHGIHPNFADGYISLFYWPLANFVGVY